MNELSPLAQKLLAFLKVSGPTHEDTCAEHLFEKPVYDPAKGTLYWEWTARMHGGRLQRQMEDGTFRDFGPYEYGDTYASQTGAAYQELRQAGLADEINNGFASYHLFAR